MDFVLTKIKELLLYDPENPMIFNSGTFLIFFILFISIYASIYKNRRAVFIFVIAFSLYFYYKSSGLYLVILILTAIADYWFALKIHHTDNQRQRKHWLYLSVGSSLGVLFFFKYSNFVLENLTPIVQYFFSDEYYLSFFRASSNPLFNSLETIAANNFQPYDIFLPIGISFYTFQSISYVIDVYKKELEPTTNFLDYFFFLSFFPQLVAGPIVKANLFLPQLKHEIEFKKEAIWTGFGLIILGLFKKAVIADYISQFNDYVFLSPETYSGFEIMMAILGYAMQIYGDFSGYSDIAIGLGLIMGFDLGLNFNYPYKALNITDFWRRWHISLSSWLRDYLYIPLGGNRHGKWMMYRNLFLTMLLGGLWHGANWKYVVWGAGHGIGLAVHKLLSPYLIKLPSLKILRFFSWLTTFVFVVLLWVFFRAVAVPETSYVYKVPENKTYHYYSQTLAQTDSSITVKVFFMDNNLHVDVLQKTFNLKSAKDIQLKSTLKENNQLITISTIIPAQDVAIYMIKKAVVDTDIRKYLLPFCRVHYLWVILILIGYTIHFIPQQWGNRSMEIFIKLPYVLKLIIFLVVIQLIIQFKNEDAIPFIYFQF